VPLSKLQTEILLLLAAHRDPESFVAGSTYSLRNRSRVSGDIGLVRGSPPRVTNVTRALKTKDSEEALPACLGRPNRWFRLFCLSYICFVCMLVCVFEGANP
jgi:hypothetical protein